MGNAILYVIAKPYYSKLTNMGQINKYCELADSCKSHIIRMINLRSVLGCTREPCYAWLENKGDFGYHAYKKWVKHLEENSEKINEYYKNNKTIY